jgi:Domain of Unknown Function (DUF1080)
MRNSNIFHAGSLVVCIFLLLFTSSFTSTSTSKKSIPGQKNILAIAVDTPDHRLKISLPANGKLVSGKPVGKNWISLIPSLGEWNADANYWNITNGVLHGDYPGGKLHNYAWTKKYYKDFELHALVRLDGKDANSGVCVRVQPTDADNAPGYQVDMGPGYWGSLWEERRAGMVQKFPDELVTKLVKDKDWNHYYIIATGHHIQAWLNGVKTIDTVHAAGFDEGAIGFQLCHGDKHTVLDVKSLYIREKK